MLTLVLLSDVVIQPSDWPILKSAFAEAQLDQPQLHVPFKMLPVA